MKGQVLLVKIVLYGIIMVKAKLHWTKPWTVVEFQYYSKKKSSINFYLKHLPSYLAEEYSARSHGKMKDQSKYLPDSNLTNNHHSLSSQSRDGSES